MADVVRDDLLRHLAGTVFDTVFPNPGAVTLEDIRRALGRVLSAYTIVPKPEIALTAAQYAALYDLMVDVVRHVNPAWTEIEVAGFRALLEDRFAKVTVTDD